MLILFPIPLGKCVPDISKIVYAYQIPPNYRIKVTIKLFSFVFINNIFLFFLSSKMLRQKKHSRTTPNRLYKIQAIKKEEKILISKKNKNTLNSRYSKYKVNSIPKVRNYEYDN